MYFVEKPDFNMVLLNCSAMHSVFLLTGNLLCLILHKIVFLQYIFLILYEKNFKIYKLATKTDKKPILFIIVL